MTEDQKPKGDGPLDEMDILKHVMDDNSPSGQDFSADLFGQEEHPAEPKETAPKEEEGIKVVTDDDLKSLFEMSQPGKTPPPPPPAPPAPVRSSPADPQEITRPVVGEKPASLAGGIDAKVNAPAREIGKGAKPERQPEEDKPSPRVEVSFGLPMPPAPPPPPAKKEPDKEPETGPRAEDVEEIDFLSEKKSEDQGGKEEEREPSRQKAAEGDSDRAKSGSGMELGFGGGLSLEFGISKKPPEKKESEKVEAKKPVPPEAPKPPPSPAAPPPKPAASAPLSGKPEEPESLIDELESRVSVGEIKAVAAVKKGDGLLDTEKMIQSLEPAGGDFMSTEELHKLTRNVNTLIDAAKDLSSRIAALEAEIEKLKGGDR